jgi:hypothetical protein
LGNSGWTADPYDITLPPDAGPDDPRIYIGSNDPVLAAIGQDAGIVWYFGPESAFAITVEQSGGPDYGQLHIYGISPGTDLKQLIDFDFDITADEATVYIAQGGDLDTDVYLGGRVVGLGGLGFLSDMEETDIEIYGTSAPRGFHDEANATADSAAITTETAVLTSGTRNYIAGRAYRVTMAGGIQASAVPNYAQFRLRKTNAVGQDLGEFFRYPIVATGVPYGAHGTRSFKVGATTVSAALCLTMAYGGVGTVTHRAIATASPRYFQVEDIGIASDFPNLPTLV